MFFCETYEMFAVNKHFCDEPIYKSEPDLPSPKAGRGGPHAERRVVGEA